MLLVTSPGHAALESLVDHFNAKLSQLKVSSQGTDGSVVLVSTLNGGQGEIGFAQADVVYGAYRQGTEDARFPHSNLSAIAVLSVNKLFVIARRGRGLRRIEDLRGRTVVVAQRGGASELFTRIVLRAHDMSYDDMKVEFQPFEAVGKRFADGTIDAMIVEGRTAPRSSAPVDPDTLLLLPIGDNVIRALRAQYPFVKPLLLSGEELLEQTEPVQTVGVESLLICRKDLDEELVYQLTKEFFSWPQSAVRFPVDWNVAAAAPIPLHPGAARFYREREILR